MFALFRHWHADFLRSSQIEPGWHAWMSYMVDKAPVDDKIMQRGVRHWEPSEHKPILTATRSAFKTYST